MSDATRLRVTLGEESYIFDRNALTLTDLYAIKSSSGLDFNPFVAGLTEGSPESLQTLIWFLRHKAGIQGDRLQIDFKIADLDMAPIEDDVTDPTEASSSSGDADTSDGSPTTSG